MELWSLTLSEARRGLAQGQFSTLEYLAALARRSQEREQLNVWVEIDWGSLYDEARSIDARGDAYLTHHALAGIPFAVKDNIAVRGMHCTGGTPALARLVPTVDAPVIDRLRRSGAMIAGKVGMHELAMGVTTNNAFSGPVHNPYAFGFSAGGSSGGSAAAVAARLVPAALGTDTGGSVRLPAAHCGIVGLRPTMGRYAREGVLPLSRTRDTVGPMARTVIDTALVDAAITGQVELPAVQCKQIRLGVPRQEFWTKLHPGVASLGQRALELMSKDGVELVEVDFLSEQVLEDRTGFLIGRYEMAEDLEVFLQTSGLCRSLEEVYAAVASSDVKHALKERFKAEAMGVDGYRAAQRWRLGLQAAYAEVFAQHRLDGLVFPTTPLPAPRLGEDDTVSLNDRELPLFSTYVRHTSPGSLAGIPGISLPMGLTEGLPVGLEIDAPAHTDRRLLGIARCVEGMLPAMPPPPESA